MYQMNDNERSTLKNTMVDLLEKYDYEYTHEALDKIIDKWATNKATLIEAFKRHPNYVEDKFLIAFESDYERDIDERAISNFDQWIRWNVFSWAIDNKKLPEDVDKIRKVQHCTWLPQKIFNNIFSNLTYFNTRTLTQAQATRINEAIPEIRAKANEKTSRVINKICTYLHYNEHPDYNREFAKYADALTPIKIKRHTILSVNPIDYLTMSFGNSWSSCHTIDKQNKRDMPNGYHGQYSSGTMSYMLDGTSMVLYTVDSKYDGNEFYSQDKINRQMFHYGEDKLIQSRLYPQCNDSDSEIYTPFRILVQEIISTIFDFPNLWVKKNNSICTYVWSRGTHYRDYTKFNSCNLTIKKDSENEKEIQIGHDPICIECGCIHENSENINCCHNGYICARCGCRIDDDDYYEIDGEYYCEGCTFYCEFCHETHVRDNGTYTDSYGQVCNDCLDEYFVQCEDCDEWIHRDDIVRLDVDGYSRWVCDSCADDYTQCDKCGEWFTDINEHDGNYYCDDCLEEIEEEENEENEEED